MSGIIAVGYSGGSEGNALNFLDVRTENQTRGAATGIDALKLLTETHGGSITGTFNTDGTGAMIGCASGVGIANLSVILDGQQILFDCPKVSNVVDSSFRMGINSSSGFGHLGDSSAAAVDGDSFYTNSFNTPSLILSGIPAKAANILACAQGNCISYQPTFSGQVDLNRYGAWLVLKDQGKCTMTAGACPNQPLGHTYFGTGAECFVTWTGNGTLTGMLSANAGTKTIQPKSTVSTDTATVFWGCFGT
jgi:hypothetical protein